MGGTLRKSAELDPGTFMNAIIKANKPMHDEVTYSGLLNAAGRDTPIINELMAEMNKLYQCENGPEKDRG